MNESQTAEPVKPSSVPEAGTVVDIRSLSSRMKAAEEAAFREFYAAYRGRLFGYLLVVCKGDEHAAKEALQETLRRVVRHIRVFEEEPVFWSWLTVLARSARADETRRVRRYFSFLDRFKSDAEVRSVEDANEGRLRRLLESGLGSLPTAERVLLEAKYYERKSVAEIAGELGLSEKGVESRLGRARRLLREVVEARIRKDADGCE